MNADLLSVSLSLMLLRELLVNLLHMHEQMRTSYVIYPGDFKMNSMQFNNLFYYCFFYFLLIYLNEKGKNNIYNIQTLYLISKVLKTKSHFE